jgi:hypothetical protein
MACHPSLGRPGPRFQALFSVNRVPLIDHTRLAGGFLPMLLCW